MDLKHLILLILGVAILLVNLLPVAKLSSQNAAFRKHIDSYIRSEIKDSYFAELDFPVKTLEHALTSEQLYFNLKDCLHSKVRIESFKLYQQPQINSVAVFGLFVGTEIFTSKNGNRGMTRYYPLHMLIKSENNGVLRVLSTFPIDGYHDSFYSDFLYHIEGCLIEA
jgi:hypothetical protein